MVMIASIILSFILIGLGSIHLHWASGRKFGLSLTVPTKITGEQVLNPKKMHCIIVGVVLTLFGIFYAIESGLIVFELSGWVLNYGSWIIPILFILRAIGEFKYVGFFKTIRETNFAKWDTKIFSPLCLLIGILGITVTLSKFYLANHGKFLVLLHFPLLEGLIFNVIMANTIFISTQTQVFFL
jgi:hypothetical protein